MHISHCTTDSCLCIYRFSSKFERKSSWLPYTNQCVITACFPKAINNTLQIIVTSQECIFQGKYVFHFNTPQSSLLFIYYCFSINAVIYHSQYCPRMVYWTFWSCPYANHTKCPTTAFIIIMWTIQTCPRMTTTYFDAPSPLLSIFQCALYIFFGMGRTSHNEAPV